MIKTKLAKAISMALAGSALAVGGISSAHATATTMYNLSTGGAVDNSTNTTDPTIGGVWTTAFINATDGWTNGADPNVSSTVGDGPNEKWAGTSGPTTSPFGYTGAHLNWGFEVTGGNGSGTISTFDSFSRYGVYADIDTARGSWSALNTGPTFAGWRHDLDVGLFRSDATGTVNLSATGVIFPSSNYGFTIFQGMDSVTGYNHHNSWNANNNTQVGAPNTASSPYTGAVLSGTALTPANIVAYSIGGASPSNLNTISFNAVAGQIYTIFIGGYRNGDWGATNDGYQLTISQATSAVPIPAAVWLFGSALAGLGVIGRRKSPAPT